MQINQIYFNRFGDGPLKGSITFSNELGEIKLQLDPKATADIVRVCGDALVRISKAAADEMTAKVIDAVTVAQIEAPPKDQP